MYVILQGETWQGVCVCVCCPMSGGRTERGKEGKEGRERCTYCDWPRQGVVLCLEGEGERERREGRDVLMFLVWQGKAGCACVCVCCLMPGFISVSGLGRTELGRVYVLPYSLSHKHRITHLFLPHSFLPPHFSLRNTSHAFHSSPQN